MFLAFLFWRFYRAYYTKNEIDEKFLSKDNALNIYSTKEELEQLSNKIEEEYVTKESLRGDSSEAGNDDFIFVT